MRSGIGITVAWSDKISETRSDAVGRYAASLALSLALEDLAGQIALAHGLTSHLTSLVIVDEAGEAVEGLPRMVKVPVHSSMVSLSYMPPMQDAIFSNLIETKKSVIKQAAHAMTRRTRMSLPDPDADADWSLVSSDQMLHPAALPALIADRVRVWKSDPDVVALAQSLGMTPHAVALLIAAFQDKTRDRNAGRFIRNCTLGIDAKKLDAIEAMALVLVE